MFSHPNYFEVTLTPFTSSSEKENPRYDCQIHMDIN